MILRILVLILCFFCRFFKWFWLRRSCWLLVVIEIYKCVRVVIFEIDLDLLNDSKSFILVSLLGKKLYFMEFDSFRELFVDDFNVNLVDRYNFKERYWRFVLNCVWIRIIYIFFFLSFVFNGRNVNKLIFELLISKIVWC